MKKFFGLSLLAAAMLASPAASAADACAKITATGHPHYPVLAYKSGDAIVGAVPALVTAIAQKIDVPLESKAMGSWADAQAAARDGKADMIFGVYYNDDRAKYLDYVQPAFVYDPVVVFVSKSKEFPFTGQDDLIGKKGATNKGESYGNEFDAFIKDKLDVVRTDGLDAAFKELVAGKVDYVIAGYYPGHATAADMDIDDKVEALEPAVLSAEMFIAFSKKSPCAALAPKFSEGITQMTTDGRFHKMLVDAMAAWDASH
jgi:polar amino acid transport system substrate-binding protein